eukprot:scaffold1318_cov388-Prasinococcus_capsulatus_cf.AAC.74
MPRLGRPRPWHSPVTYRCLFSLQKRACSHFLNSSALKACTPSRRTKVPPRAANHSAVQAALPAAPTMVHSNARPPERSAGTDRPPAESVASGRNRQQGRRSLYAREVQGATPGGMENVLLPPPPPRLPTMQRSRAGAPADPMPKLAAPSPRDSVAGAAASRGSHPQRQPPHSATTHLTLLPTPTNSSASPSPSAPYIEPHSTSHDSHKLRVRTTITAIQREHRTNNHHHDSMIIIMIR